jgi:proteasome lid subunit RPN8/RPN11
MPKGNLVLAIRKQHLERLHRKAKRVWPLEACALLVGCLKGEFSKTSEIRITENIDDSPVTFRIDPIFLYEAYTKAESEGKEIIGIFHSHPAPPTPSSIDIQYMKTYPVIWLIMSMPTGSMKAYQWRDEALREVEMRILA